MITDQITILIFIVISIYLSIKSFSLYLEKPKNFENTLYYGLSFMVLAVVFTLLGFKEFIEVGSIHQWNKFGDLMFSLAWWLQLYAIEMSIYLKNYKKRKKFRVVNWLLLFVILLSHIVFYCPYIVQLTHVLLSILILATLIQYKLTDLSLPYLLLFIAESVSLANVFYNIEDLSQFGHGFQVVGIILLFLVIKNNIIQEG